LLEETVEVQLGVVGELVKISVLDFFSSKVEVLALRSVRMRRNELPFWEYILLRY
jgi:hypothetical protein